jgi:hypothetical protein
MREHKAGRCVYDYHWDIEDLSLNGVHINCELDPEYSYFGEVVNPPMPGIPFADLAVDVNAHPSYSRGDGFIFTRCVQYAALHPDRGYNFPRDYAYLAEKLDDGRQLLPHHLDQASATRWLKKSTWLIDEQPEVETFESEDEVMVEDIHVTLPLYHQNDLTGDEANFDMSHQSGHGLFNLSALDAPNEFLEAALPTVEPPPTQAHYSEILLPLEAHISGTHRASRLYASAVLGC